MRLNETHVGLGVSQVGSFDPTDTVPPFLPLQLGHQSALTNEDSRMSHWNAPLGELALATGCSSVCQSSFVPISSNTLTLPQIEPTSNTDTAVTQTEMGKNTSSSYSHCKTPKSCNSTTSPPSLAHYNAMADMIAYPFIPLPVCSPLDFPYQDFSSISTFPYDALADPGPSNYSYVLNSTGDTSYPLSVDTAPSNNLGVLHQTDTGPLLIEYQTGDEESMSSSGNGSLCAPISLESSDNCCMNQLKTYPSGGERKPDPYRSTVREAYLISPNDTLCNDQAGAHKCNYSSPVTGEPCGAILSRVYDCNRHEDSILLDSEKGFKCHLCSKKAYKRKDGLSKNMQKMHKEQAFHHRYLQSNKTQCHKY